MASKINDNYGLPLVVTLGTEAVLIATPTVTAPQAEIGMSSDSGLAMIRRAVQGVFAPIVEYWRADQTTDTAPTVDASTKKITVQTTQPSNAFYIEFVDPATGIGGGLYLVLEDA